MLNIGLIFPHQLFEKSELIAKCNVIYLIEEYLYFNQYRFHQQKIAFHRATMQFYAQYLQSKGIEVRYIDAKNELSDIRNLFPFLKNLNINVLHYIDTIDNWLEKRIIQGAKTENIIVEKYHSPLFLNTFEEIEHFFAEKKTFFQTDFYKFQRKKQQILLDHNQKPIGGKWTFDAENRLKYPKDKLPPKVNFPVENQYNIEATTYTAHFFSENYGELSADFRYPVTFEDAKIWFNQFLETRFKDFGIYEDAMVGKESILHHSVLTPMLNIGLITPNYIVTETLHFANKHDIPINSTEGFIRQIIGWREFIRAVYELKGTQERTTNFWNFSKKIPTSFWEGKTGIVPFDQVVKKVLKTGYCHHIERLMVLGNFMLLCEFDPDEVYRWFMELFIDAYDWVMVPNVYGMSQFADGGLMATKPYISGSNYLMKMSDFPKGNWQEVWDGLFWRFMHVHSSFFLQNPRLGMLVRTFDKMPQFKKQAHFDNAERFLANLSVKTTNLTLF